jgi:carbonic anhydrase
MAKQTPARSTNEATDLDYVPPRHNVLLLSCMDARLIDELAAFMSNDNLTNRYDHVVLAGASLGVLQDVFPGWRQTFFDHLRLAIELHQIKDIYIVEHRNCGAYRMFLEEDYDDSRKEQEREERDHAERAFRLRDEIRDWCAGQRDDAGRPIHLGVKCFLMDLRGNVRLLDDPRGATTAKARSTREKPSTPGRKGRMPQT